MWSIAALCLIWESIDPKDQSFPSIRLISSASWVGDRCAGGAVLDLGGLRASWVCPAAVMGNSLSALSPLEL